MKLPVSLAAALGMSLAAASAHAAVLFTLAAPTVKFESPGEVSETFDSAGGVGEVNFFIDAFGSLDGANLANGNTDTFTLSLNGVAILRGSWDLGGGGDNILNLAPVNATVLAQSPPGFDDGGTLQITAALGLAAGKNTLTFAFATENPKGPTDESWALRSAQVTGPAAPAGVPEPATWALMVGGFFGTGAAVRGARRRTAAA